MLQLISSAYFSALDKIQSIKKKNNIREFFHIHEGICFISSPTKALHSLPFTLVQRGEKHQELSPTVFFYPSLRNGATSLPLPWGCIAHGCEIVRCMTEVLCSVLAAHKAMSDSRICLYENISAFHRIFSFLSVRHIRYVLMTTPD